nr:hypothetical protein [uncultured Eisenbergiella sp.]
MDDGRVYLPLAREVMKIDTRTQAIDMQQIENRRFMFDPGSGTLVLGYQYEKTSLLVGSHADELAKAGVTAGYDNYIRGWIGTGGAYPHGVIHFAPHIDKQSPITRFDRAFNTLEMFRANGARGQTIVRGFCEPWEQPLSAILSPTRDVEQKPSVRARLKETPPQVKAPRRKPAQGREH